MMVQAFVENIALLCEVIVLLLFFLIFGLFCVAYFKGQFYSCQIADEGELCCRFCYEFRLRYLHHQRFSASIFLL